MDLKESLKYIKLRENTISFIVGLLVLSLSVFIFYKYFFNKTKDVVQNFPPLQLGEVTPNLTSAYPQDGGSLAGQSPTVVVNNPANTSSTSTEAESYTVQRGDTLWSISEKQLQSGFKWKEIADVNKITTPDKIEVGQKLFIPNVAVATIATSEETGVSKSNPLPNKWTSINVGTYTVVKGDCLWNIAVRAYGDGFKWSEIARENNLKTPQLIHPGDKFVIPR